MERGEKKLLFNFQASAGLAGKLLSYLFFREFFANGNNLERFKLAEAAQKKLPFLSSCARFLL